MSMRWPRTARQTYAIAQCFIVLAAGGCGHTTEPGMREGVDGAFIRAAQTWDLNHDGNVTCEEWRTYALSVFKDADLNHDGKLTPDEFIRLAKIDHLFDIADFKYYDVNRQGYVTQEEFVDRPNPAFVELDKDKTCVLKTYQLRAATMPAAPKRENPGVPGSH
jgi:Ca2+-binding EF-hand superfamily protein